MQYEAEKGKNIISAIKEGTPYQIAAEANGVREWQLNKWIDDGLDQAQEGTVTELSLFAVELRKSEQTMIRRELKNIRRQPKSWKNSAWLLERTFPRHFGKDTLEIKDMQTLLLTLRQDMENIKNERVLQKPVVKQLEDEILCSKDNQPSINGEGNG